MPANGRWDLIRRLKVNDNGQRTVIISASKTLIVKSPIFVIKFGPIQLERLTISLIKYLQQTD